MLNSIRNFSKTIFAKILLFIVIIPFVFWGMGGVFSSGNTNSLAKIDNINISTQEFIEHINALNINQEAIRENLDNEIVEELLSELISKKILEIQINELDINITKKNLANIIKKNPNFFDENNNFSRLKYEKFLLTNQIDAPTFERRLKERELQNNLFNFISGGIYSPLFLTKKLYENETKKIEIEYIDLKEIYGSKDSIKNNDVNKYIDKNENNLKQEFINYSYVKLTPADLIGSEEYNQIFFDKIDEIENKILTGNSLNQIVLEYKLEKKSKENVNVSSELTNIDNKILDLSSKSQIDIIDMNEFYLLYEIENIVKKLPDRNNDSFIKSVKDKIYQEKRINHNIELLQKINAKKFTDADFNKIVNSLKPHSFTDYISLQKNSELVISDSGTLMEETAILKTKSIMIRNSHERPEGMDTGTLLVSGLDKNNLSECINLIKKNNQQSKVPTDYLVDDFSKKISKIILSYFGYIKFFHKKN